MSTFYNKWLTFINLQTLITNGTLVEKPGHGYDLGSNELIIKTQAFDIVDIDPSFPPYAGLSNNQWVTEDNISGIAPPAQDPPTAPTDASISEDGDGNLIIAPTYVRADWSGATSDGQIEGFNVYIEGVFSHYQPSNVPGGVTSAGLSGGSPGIPSWIHGSSQYIEVESVDNLGQVSPTKYGFYVETQFYFIETPLQDCSPQDYDPPEPCVPMNVDALRCTAAPDMVFLSQRGAGCPVIWEASTNSGASWTTIGTTPETITVATPSVNTWYRYRTTSTDFECTWDGNGDGILDAVYGTYGVNVKTC